MEVFSISDYIDVYFQRANHRGSSVAEVAWDSEKRSFEKWLRETPNSPKEPLSVDNKCFFKGAILSHKDKEYRKSKLLYVSMETPLSVGDIVNWDDEKWIIYHKKRRVRETFQVFYMIRCNYLIKWVDNNGNLNQSWCYFVSSMESKIKENFRTWNNLITPQPNKYGEILLPFSKIDKYTKFIINDEGWFVVEYDSSSVPGITYLSLTEDKLNMVNDDLKNEIADKDKIAKYSFITSKEQNFKVGDYIDLIYSVMRNGSPVLAKTVEEIKEDGVLQRDENGAIFAAKQGTTSVKVFLEDSPENCTEISIKVNETPTLVGFILGKEKIRLDREEKFGIELSTPNELLDFNFEIDNKELASVKKLSRQTCLIQANKKNKTGKILLKATSSELTLVKEIEIVPLW